MGAQEHPRRSIQQASDKKKTEQKGHVINIPNVRENGPVTDLKHNFFGWDS